MLSIAAIPGRLRRWRIDDLDAAHGLIVDHPRFGFLPWKPDRFEAYCTRCGATAGPGSVTARGCAFCVNKRISWHRITRLGEYAEPLDEAVKAMKFARDWARAGWFGRQLAPLIDVIDPPHTIVVPVPMHRFRQWSRGYNQAHLIATALADELRLPVLPLLKRTRYTTPQTRLTTTARRTNLTRAFAAHPVDLADHDVLLVDDVKTTGSTLTGCTQALCDLGARSVHCVVAAVADHTYHGFMYM